MTEWNKYSKTVTQDPTQPAAQAMLHAIGLTTEDLKKPRPDESKMPSADVLGNIMSFLPQKTLPKVILQTRIKFGDHALKHRDFDLNNLVVCAAFRVEDFDLLMKNQNWIDVKFNTAKGQFFW